ncbi:MAG: hypothetical protein ISS36_03650 [Candidatus Aenigmarchaeota archaeon]|nr:hypothetical protein [Candidatus Aenigmarchaeota archaeon]
MVNLLRNIENKKSFLLITIIFLAVFLTYYPHIDYPYPLHVDEWFHIANVKMLALNEEIDWYSGEIIRTDLEIGWHGALLLIGIFNLSVNQWTLVPSFLHVLAILSVFYFILNFFGKNQALISAFLIALIPSSVRFGGPVFLVPINIGLIFIPLALVFAFELTLLRRFYNLLALFLITTFLLYAHPPTAIVLLIILGFYFILNLVSKEEFCKRKARDLFLTILLSGLISFPNYIHYIQLKGLESIKFDFWLYMKDIFGIYGIIPTIFFFVGFYLLTTIQGKKIWSLLLTTLLLLLNIVLFSRYGLNWLVSYQKIYIPLFLLMSIIASFGLSKLIEIKKPFKSFGLILLLFALLLTGVFAVQSNMETTYYYLIDNEDYESFLWIGENTTTDALILINPMKARALPPVAERRVYATIPFGPDEERLSIAHEANDFLNNRCTDTVFLIERNISIIYSPLGCDNPDLLELENGIYLLKNLSHSK